MRDRLETFIKDNRKEFDVDHTPNGLWDKIETQLNQQSKKVETTKFYWYKIAASIVLVLGVLVVTYLNNNRSVDVADLNPEYANKQAKFAGLIVEKKDSLAYFASADPNLYKKFTEDLKVLDEDYERLKKELVSTPNQQMILKAMVRNRENQLQLLKQQLLIFNDVIDVNGVTSI